MAHPVPLDAIFPRPSVVTLAGEPFACRELTLGQLATLQGWIRMAARRPGAEVDPPGEDAAARKARLLREWAAAKSWPPILGSDADVAYLDSPEGRAVFVLLCLWDLNEGFGAEEASDLSARMSPADWIALRRVAWAVPPWRDLAARIDAAWLAEALAKGDGDGPEWAEAVLEVMAKGGYTFDEIERWTPTQFNLYRSGGKLSTYRAVRLPGETDEQLAVRMRETFRAPD